MSNPDDPNGSPTGRRRRSSFTEMFARPSIDTSAASSLSTNGPRTSSMAAAMQSRARRMSITSLGLSGSPNGQSPGGSSAFDSLKGSTRQRANGEEAVEDEDEVPPLNGEDGRPTSPSLQRRLSFGARAYRASSASGGSEGSGSATSESPNGGNGNSPPGTRKGNEGFNWSENLRARAQRSSISAGTGNPASFAPFGSIKGRSASVADPGAAAPQAAPPPAPPPQPKAPDHFQERILKGDFYMD